MSSESVLVDDNSYLWKREPFKMILKYAKSKKTAAHWVRFSYIVMAFADKNGVADVYDLAMSYFKDFMIRDGYDLEEVSYHLSGMAVAVMLMTGKNHVLYKKNNKLFCVPKWNLKVIEKEKGVKIVKTVADLR